MPESHRHIPAARDFMARSLVTLSPEASVLDAISTLVKHRISGAPVVEATGKMVGMLSEADCLRVLCAGEFYSDDCCEVGVVRDYMTVQFKYIDPEMDIYAVAQYLLTHSVRKLPVLEDGELVGQVSRRDVLAAMEQHGRSRVRRKHYPDYIEPAQDVGARRSS